MSHTCIFNSLLMSHWSRVNSIASGVSFIIRTTNFSVTSVVCDLLVNKRRRRRRHHRQEVLNYVYLIKFDVHEHFKRLSVPRQQKKAVIKILFYSRQKIFSSSSISCQVRIKITILYLSRGFFIKMNISLHFNLQVIPLTRFLFYFSACNSLTTLTQFAWHRLVFSVINKIKATVKIAFVA